jgi:hypothetical protein
VLSLPLSCVARGKCNVELRFIKYHASKTRVEVEGYLHVLVSVKERSRYRQKRTKVREENRWKEGHDKKVGRTVNKRGNYKIKWNENRRRDTK